MKLLYSFDFMDYDIVRTHVDVYDNGKVEFENFTDDVMEKAFGAREEVDSVDVMKFFARRCMPPDRDNIDRALKELGLERYNPKAIVEKTHGLRIEDTNWVRFNGVTKTFAEVNEEVYEGNLIR